MVLTAYEIASAPNNGFSIVKTTLVMVEVSIRGIQFIHLENRTPNAMDLHAPRFSLEWLWIELGLCNVLRKLDHSLFWNANSEKWNPNYSPFSHQVILMINLWKIWRNRTVWSWNFRVLESRKYIIELEFKINYHWTFERWFRSGIRNNNCISWLSPIVLRSNFDSLYIWNKNRLCS